MLFRPLRALILSLFDTYFLPVEKVYQELWTWLAKFWKIQNSCFQFVIKNKKLWLHSISKWNCCHMYNYIVNNYQLHFHHNVESSFWTNKILIIITITNLPCQTRVSFMNMVSHPFTGQLWLLQNKAKPAVWLQMTQKDEVLKCCLDWFVQPVAPWSCGY